jgi:hypothetical protein
MQAERLACSKALTSGSERWLARLPKRAGQADLGACISRPEGRCGLMGPGKDVAVMFCSGMYRVAAHVAADKVECRLSSRWGGRPLMRSVVATLAEGTLGAEACGEVARSSHKYLGGGQRAVRYPTLPKLRRLGTDY